MQNNPESKIPEGTEGEVIYIYIFIFICVYIYIYIYVIQNRGRNENELKLGNSRCMKKLKETDSKMK